MADSRRTVLITGCSDGGMGAALAKELHEAGLHVYATARDVAKTERLTSLGIETLALDVQSESSIESCVNKISHLDILINNAGLLYTMPIADVSILEAKKIFDVNVWGYLAVTQAFLPLLLKSPHAIIVNHTSAGADISIPFQGVYNASKAATSRFSDAMRLELQAVGISVVELRTGGVKTNVVANVQTRQPELPAGSIYTPAKELVETALRYEWFGNMGITAEQWAKEVVADLLKKPPPLVIWRVESAWLARLGSVFPFGWFDGRLKKLTGLDKVESALRTQEVCISPIK